MWWSRKTADEQFGKPNRLDAANAIRTAHGAANPATEYFEFHLLLIQGGSGPLFGYRYLLVKLYSYHSFTFIGHSLMVAGAWLSLSLNMSVLIFCFITV
jgi:hypothetical protein